MRIIRAFPRRTKATPTDQDVRINCGPLLFDDIDKKIKEVHISVTFTWDLLRAEWLKRQWRHIAPVLIGGPATGTAGGVFESGIYVKQGYVITSRGCPNKCWFCNVWRREGSVRELPVRAGWNVLDDNLLACSDEHIKSVFVMLAQQKERVQFTGGLEAARLKAWHVEALRKLRPKQMFFAYDTPDDLEPLRCAGKMLLDIGWTVASKTLRAYVLCGYPKDTFDKAEKRMRETVVAGFTPMAMLYKDKSGNASLEWRRFQRRWARPAMSTMVRGAA